MIKRIIIVGHGGSGKDFLKMSLVMFGMTPSISYTTRPMREGEEAGVSYHFLTEERFHELTKAGQFLETDCFRGWYYGTGLEDFQNSQVFIMTVAGIHNIPQAERENSFIIFLDIDRDIRKMRLEARQDVDSVNRRLITDDKDFSDFTEFDLRVTDHEFKFTDIVSVIPAEYLQSTEQLKMVRDLDK
jgi:guanylate kinase